MSDDSEDSCTSSSEFSEWREDKRRCCACCGLCALSSLCALIAVASVRHMTRSQHLEPLLEVITGATACREPQRGVCELDFGQEAAVRFDLREHEGPILGFLYRQVLRGQREEMLRVLSGAHVKLQDADGSIYDYLRHLPGARRRISSHRSERATYGVPEGRVLSGLLMGTLGNSTWLQLEGSPWDPCHRFWTSLGHVLDFAEYAALRRNVGPLGTSGATDRHPLLAGAPAPTSEVCPVSCRAKPAPPAPATPPQLRGGGSVALASERLL